MMANYSIVILLIRLTVGTCDYKQLPDGKQQLNQTFTAGKLLNLGKITTITINGESISDVQFIQGIPEILQIIQDNNSDSLSLQQSKIYDNLSIPNLNTNDKLFKYINTETTVQSLTIHTGTSHIYNGNIKDLYAFGGQHGNSINICGCGKVTNLTINDKYSEIDDNGTTCKIFADGTAETVNIISGGNIIIEGGLVNTLIYNINTGVTNISIEDSAVISSLVFIKPKEFPSIPDNITSIDESIIKNYEQQIDLINFDINIENNRVINENTNTTHALNQNKVSCYADPNNQKTTFKISNIISTNEIFAAEEKFHYKIQRSDVGLLFGYFNVELQNTTVVSALLMGGKIQIDSSSTIKNLIVIEGIVQNDGTIENLIIPTNDLCTNIINCKFIKDIPGVTYLTDKYDKFFVQTTSKESRVQNIYNNNVINKICRASAIQSKNDASGKPQSVSRSVSVKNNAAFLFGGNRKNRQHRFNNSELRR